MQAAIVFQLTCTFFAEFETHYTTFQGLKQPLKLGTHMYLFTLSSKNTDPQIGSSFIMHSGTHHRIQGLIMLLSQQ